MKKQLAVTSMTECIDINIDMEDFYVKSECTLLWNKDKPEESNLRQQSENPYSTAKCKGNIPLIPRLEMPKTYKQNVRNENSQC